jgi:hypothetical protein
VLTLPLEKTLPPRWYEPRVQAGCLYLRAGDDQIVAVDDLFVRPVAEDLGINLCIHPDEYNITPLFLQTPF